MLTKLKTKNEGFTIVETLIVLAIAGLIILIVLLAVPALQRSSQNSNIKSDAEAVSSEINDYESNNGGQLPTAAGNVAGVLTISGAGSSSTGKVQPTDNIVMVQTKATSPTFATVPTAGTSIGVGYILADSGETCPSSTVGTGVALTASPSAIAVFYPINDGGSGTANGVGCLQS